MFTNEVCIDHPEVQALVNRINDRRVITYGFNPQADVRAENRSEPCAVDSRLNRRGEVS